MQPTNSLSDELPEDVLLLMNQLCNLFEQGWLQGQQPKIEEVLEGVAAKYRDPFLRELVALEAVYRHRAGLDASPAYFQARFPSLKTSDLSELLVSATQDDRPIDHSGRLIGHYRLQQRLGAGGMGVVYRAYDTALGRECALKVLGHRVVPQVRERIVREAKSLARLQHPGIASFYDSGEDGNEWYLAMELVRGQTMRQRLTTGALPWDEITRLASSLLEALGHAHVVGILHRDIKPDNIMVTEEGLFKLVDFGLAKDYVKLGSGNQTASVLTRAGSIVGTMGYMSPEQLRGDALDERSDIFAVGAVLYEAATGEPAFPGTVPEHRIAAILSVDPAQIERNDIPTDFNAICLKAMSRDPALRYPNVTAFLSDLLLAGSGEFQSGFEKSLAVFDFNNIVGLQEDDWIGAGTSETLCTRLAMLRGLDVKPREELLRLIESEPQDSRAALALNLGCRWFLEGGYQRLGDTLRFTFRLKDALTQDTILSRQVDGSYESIFELQDQIATMLKEQLGQRESTGSVRKEATPKLSAYECYVKGQQALLHTDKGRMDRAEEWFDRAIAIDPDYAAALSGQATIHAFRYTFTTDPTVLDVAESFAKRAIESDSELSDPHVWLGYIHFHRGNLGIARREAQEAIRLNPKSVWAHYFDGFFAYLDRSATRRTTRSSSPATTKQEHRQRFSHGLESLQRALQLDDKHGWAWLGAGALHMELEQFPESRWCFEQGIELESTPNRMVAGIEGCLAESLRREGHLDEARGCCLRGLQALDNTDNIYRDTFRAAFLCFLGEIALAQSDATAARAAFQQAVLHCEGRNRARSLGHAYVQALCGLCRINSDRELFQKSLAQFRDREAVNFDPFWLCSEDATLLALAKTASAVGESELAKQFQTDAILSGSNEASRLLLS